MEYTTFSCFDNFVRGNCAGIPDHTPMHYALQHLEEWVFSFCLVSSFCHLKVTVWFIPSGRLLSNISKKLSKLMSESELISKLTANGGTYGSGGNQQQQQQQSSNNLDHSGGQEMDIDILQVKIVKESLETQITRHLFFQTGSRCDSWNAISQ